MNRNTIYILLIASILVEIANTKEHPLSPVTPKAMTTIGNLSETEIIQEKWKVFQKNMQKTMDEYMKKAMPTILKMGSNAELSAKCSNDMMALNQGVRGRKNWALRMIDANAKLPTGIMFGNLEDYGEYDECLAIVKLDNKKKTQFTGQHCVVEAKPLLPPAPNKPLFNTSAQDIKKFLYSDWVLSESAEISAAFDFTSLRLGLCLPSTCSTEDLQEIANLALKDVPLIAKVARCEVKQPFVISYLQLASLSAIGVLVLLAVIGTFLDVTTASFLNSWNKMYSGIVADSLKCFSVDRNLKKLLRINQSKENFGVFNSLRVISQYWVVLHHIYYSHIWEFGLDRVKNEQNILEEVILFTVNSGFVIVDNFFMIGAFLVAYSNLKSLERNNGHMNLVRYYLHRIWRLTPPLTGCLLIMFLLPLLGSGPLFKQVVGREVEVCEKYWWRTLITPTLSWTPLDKLCLLHIWYIGTDMHYYFLAPAILIPLYKWPVIGFMLMVFLTLACMSIVAVLTAIHDFYPTQIFFVPDKSLFILQMEEVYYRPYCHIGPYCIGLALGYLVLHYRRVDINPFHQVLGWCAAIACSLSVLYPGYHWSWGNFPSKGMSVTFAMYHRTAWAISIAWIAYICIVGKGGVINRFLSWNAFIPLNRLSYTAYVIHYPLLWMRNGMKRKVLFFHHYDVLYDFVGTLVMTLCLSIVFHLLFEAPFPNLEELWFPKKDREMKSTSKYEHDKYLKIY